MRQWWNKLRAWMTGRTEIDDDLAEEVRRARKFRFESKAAAAGL